MAQPCRSLVLPWWMVRATLKEPEYLPGTQNCRRAGELYTVRSPVYIVQRPHQGSQGFKVRRHYDRYPLSTNPESRAFMLRVAMVPPGAEYEGFGTQSPRPALPQLQNETGRTTQGPPIGFRCLPAQLEGCEKALLLCTAFRASPREALAFRPFSRDE